MKLISSTLLGALALSLASFAMAEAPTTTTSTNVGGDINVNVVTDGMVVNAGAAIGGHADLEASVGSTHGDTTVGGSLNIDVQVGQLGVFGLGASVLNAGITTGGGDLCAKTAIGSIGASSCSYR